MTGPGHLAGTREADYQAFRRGCGAYRLPRDVLTVTGAGAVDYLQGQCSQDVVGLAPGESADALLLEPDGKLAALVRVVRQAEDGFVVDVEAGYGEMVAARLARFKLRSKVDIAPVDWTCVALRGAGVAGTPSARLAAGMVASGGVADGGPISGGRGVYSLPVRWNGVVGIDLLGPDADAAVPAGAHWCGTAAWEALRVEAGIPAMGRELDGRTIAAEAGLVERTVSFTKGCYTGQELVARLDARGNRVARRLCGVVVEVAHRLDVDDHHLVGAELVVPGGDKVVGTVTSAAWCPGIGRMAALAYVHRSVAVPGPLAVVPASTDGGSPESLLAEVRTLPLVAG